MDYTQLAVNEMMALVNIPSPTGMTDAACAYVHQALIKMGFNPEKTIKGTVLCALGGEGHPLLLSAHLDTLGAVVRAIKSSGTLRYMKIGGFSDNAVENENCLVHASNGQTYTGTIRPLTASRHVFGDNAAIIRSDETVEITLDELVYSKEDVQKLGIEVGDMITFDPRAMVTPSGYIKSRHLDDKASSGILLALARAVKDGALKLKRQVHIMFTIYEEVGHGASGKLPCGIEDMIAVDMGCVGGDLSCRETQVSICVKDGAGPYNPALIAQLVQTARDNGIDYAKDVYPFYSSDTATALAAGLEARHALIGPGVFASHTYERTHVRAIENTLKLLWHTAG